MPLGTSGDKLEKAARAAAVVHPVRFQEALADNDGVARQQHKVRMLLPSQGRFSLLSCVLLVANTHAHTQTHTRT